MEGGYFAEERSERQGNAYNVRHFDNNKKVHAFFIWIICGQYSRNLKKNWFWPENPKYFFFVYTYRNLMTFGNAPKGRETAMQILRLEYIWWICILIFWQYTFIIPFSRYQNFLWTYSRVWVFVSALYLHTNVCKVYFTFFF